VQTATAEILEQGDHGGPVIDQLVIGESQHLKATSGQLLVSQAITRVVVHPGVMRHRVALEDESLTQQQVDSESTDANLWPRPEADRCQVIAQERLRA